MSDYPGLMWSPAGEEVTVYSAADEAARAADGYVTSPPGAAPAELEPEPEREPDDSEPAKKPKKGR